MPLKKAEKYKPANLEEIKDNPYLLKEQELLLRFINKDFDKFINKGIFSAGRRARKKLTRLRTVSLYLYRAIHLLQKERKLELDKIKRGFIFNTKSTKDS